MNYKVTGIVPSIRDGKLTVNDAYINYALMFSNRVKMVLSEEDVKEVDLLMLTGGVDINPAVFGYNNYSSQLVDSKMDLWQIRLLDAAVNHRKDVFGICRGMQLIAYHYLIGMMGGTWIDQHIPGHDQGSLSVSRGEFFHSVDRVGGGTMWVNSMHHQAMRASELHRGITHYVTDKKLLIVVGFMVKIESSKVFGVQWHPEELMMLPDEIWRK
jgi:putative glutamine amidotransferase